MRSRFTAVGIWGLGVVVAVALSLAAVSSVGDRVSDRRVDTVSAAAVAAQLDAGAGSPAGSETEMADGAGPPSDPTTSTTQLPAPSTTAATGGGGAVVTSPPPTTRTTEAPIVDVTPDGGATPPPTTTDDNGGDGGGGGGDGGGEPAAPVAVETTFLAVGGSARASCTGSQITLVFATPAVGFEVDGVNVNADTIDARFRAEDKRESRIRIACVSGRPEGTVEER